jgi:hypothetical protein
MLVAVRQRAAVIARLANHLPLGKYLQQLATGLVNGKLGHVLAAYAAPRLPATTSGGKVANPTTLNYQLQVAYNRVARSITGVRLKDLVSVPDLLKQAGIPSVNQMVARAVAIEAWSCRHSNDNTNSTRNFVGSLIFNQVAQRPAWAAALREVGTLLSRTQPRRGSCRRSCGQWRKSPQQSGLQKTLPSGHRFDGDPANPASIA